MIDPIIQEMQRAITHLNDTYTQMAIDIAVLKNQMLEVMWLIRSLFAVSLAFIVSRLWKMFVSWKNHQK